MLKQNTLVELRNVRKSFGRAVVLNDISLLVHKQEFLAIVGPSGSGKTTLAHVIGGLLTPDNGEVMYAGENIPPGDKRLSLYRNEDVGFVFQNFSLIPHYTAVENIALPLVVAGVPAQKRQKRAVELLKTMGLLEKKNVKAETLSGGERQRIAIARALVMNPAIIIADEPTGSLDSRRGSEIIAILRKLKTQGVTIVMVTHDQIIAKHADRVLHILDGAIDKEEIHASI
jgi:putative ABC transport system ATP-binding protein